MRTKSVEERSSILSKFSRGRDEIVYDVSNYK